MPHCIFEYSSNIIDEPDWTRVMLDIHDVLMATGMFKLPDIKSRVIRHDHYVIGDNKDQQAFVTLNIQIRSGRTDEVKASISEAALKALVPLFPRTLAERKLSITVQISELHHHSYRRHTNY